MVAVPRWLLVFSLVLALAVTLAVVLPPSQPGQVSAPEMVAAAQSAALSEPDSPHANMTEAEFAALVETTFNDPTFSGKVEVEVPAVEQDPCLHCHVSGENKGVWTPVSRWTLFGAAGMIFAFGTYRSASTWITRKPWKPFTARAADWVDARYGIKAPLEKALNKPVPTHALKWFYCLGGITAMLFAVLGVTGILLAFHYKPTPAEAYASIQFIESEVRFGAATRAIHHWAANGMIVMCVAHMLRVFISGAYKAPRELNWVGGVLLLFMTLAFGFTGYLLPWDQRAFWATTVGTEIAGGVPDLGPLVLVFLRSGWTVSAQTLGRFFAAHVLVLPAATVVLMGLHFLMVRRQGIAEPL
jgi:hypothetical protein